MSIPENLRTMHIGKKIQRVRELRGIKQDALANKLGLTQQAVSYIEQSENVDDEKLKRIAEALELTVDDIKNFAEEAIFTNNVYGEKNTLTQVYSQPISEIHVYNQINPIDKVIELIEENRKLYERLLKEKDDIIAMYRNQQQAS
jgi:transcriptional regulator with XRE-family HTH domain